MTAYFDVHKMNIQSPPDDAAVFVHGIAEGDIYTGPRFGCVHYQAEGPQEPTP